VSVRQLARTRQQLVCFS